jgi:hypothetical protein
VLVIRDGGEVGIPHELLGIAETGIYGLAEIRESFVFLPEQRIATRDVIQDVDSGLFGLDIPMTL